jgi:hypothetical protein
MKRSLRLPIAALVAIACLGAADRVAAYNYTIVDQYTVPISYVHMHTVSAFCHDVETTPNVGPFDPPSNVSLSSASICLVDGIEACLYGTGQCANWSEGVGIVGQDVCLLPDGNGNPSLLPSQYDLPQCQM